eukprot:9102399-Lingulodinium_polyedra.AAC.1
MPSNQPYVAATAQIVRVAHAMREPKMVSAWSARRVRFASRCGGDSDRDHHCVAFENVTQ